MNNRMDKAILLISLLICVLTLITSYFGFFTSGFYDLETSNWKSQSIGQDAINLLFIAPVLILTIYLGYNKGFYSKLMWAGTIVYIIYTYLIYCFNVHFNQFFIVYCTIVGLSFYSLIYFFIKDDRWAKKLKGNKFTNLVGIYFLIISIIFYFLWLQEIIPSIKKGSIPQSIINAGLFTNPVHVLDLSIVLPGIFITGILVLRKKRTGIYLAPILLMFFVLMDVTIGSLVLVLKFRGHKADISVVIIMGTLAVISSLLLMNYKKYLETESITA